jgi:hypothetical protein
MICSFRPSSNMDSFKKKENCNGKLNVSRLPSSPRDPYYIRSEADGTFERPSHSGTSNLTIHLTNDQLKRGGRGRRTSGPPTTQK